MKRVLVFGATSSIATEFAKRMAGEGARLHLVARNADKLAGVVQSCESIAPSARITTTVADFARLDANEDVVRTSLETLGTVDVALVAHGDLGDQLESERSFVEAERILTANFTSVVSLLVPLANAMEAAGKGAIGVITSVAGDRGRPRNYTYGAAKGALNVYLQGLRTRLYPSGVSVTTLKLGPVDSPMTKDHAKHALFGRPESVAKDIDAAIRTRVPEAYVPFFWRAIMPVVKNTPEFVFQKLPFLSGR